MGVLECLSSDSLSSVAWALYLSHTPIGFLPGGVELVLMLWVRIEAQFV
jgi:hypothetical protein